MSRPALFATGLSLGALVTPLAYHLACRYTHRHWLAVQMKEF